MELSRDQLRQEFLIANGWHLAAQKALPSDASFRCYFRLEDSYKGQAMLMDAPPPMEDVRPFIHVAEHLNELGLSAPLILARDEENGFLLLEDFGNDTFTRLLRSGEAETPLYAMAVDALVHLQNTPQATRVKLPAYDLEVLLREAALLPDWFYPAQTGTDCPGPARQAYMEAWTNVIAALPVVGETLVLRDYHVDNLMRLPGRIGGAECGILDFQDALIGSPAYDLVSLLEDARRDVSPELTSKMLERYHAGRAGLDRQAFDAWYAVLGAQRHAKVAGIFLRLLLRDGKDVYLEHIPRVVRLFARQLENPMLAPVRDWMTAYLPGYRDPLPDCETLLKRRPDTGRV